LHSLCVCAVWPPSRAERGIPTRFIPDARTRLPQPSALFRLLPTRLAPDRGRLLSLQYLAGPGIASAARSPTYFPLQRHPETEGRMRASSDPHLFLAPAAPSESWAAVKISHFICPPRLGASFSPDLLVTRAPAAPSRRSTRRWAATTSPPPAAPPPSPRGAPSPGSRASGFVVHALTILSFTRQLFYDVHLMFTTILMFNCFEAHSLTVLRLTRQLFSPVNSPPPSPRGASCPAAPAPPRPPPRLPPPPLLLLLLRRRRRETVPAAAAAVAVGAVVGVGGRTGRRPDR
jgi:hypothetical protein